MFPLYTVAINILGKWRKLYYGAPKITIELRKTGEIISERTVSTYMRQIGIRAQWSKPWTITTKDSDFSTELQNILDEQFNPNRPNAVKPKLARISTSQ